MFSSASFLSFISVASASFAPAAVLASTTVCKQPAHLILAIFAAFLWSCAISVVALVWIALFRPLGAPLWVVALCAVVLQELARWATYALFEAMLRGLRSAGLMPHDGPRTAAQQVPAAVSSGLGAGVMQVLVMHGDVLAGALRPGTLYAPSCSALSLFAVDALTNLACIALNVLLMAIELLNNGVALDFHHTPFGIAFGVVYVLWHHLYRYRRTHTLLYFFLSWQSPHALKVLAALVAAFAVFFGLGVLLTEAVRPTAIGAPLTLLLVASIMRLRPPKERRLGEDGNPIGMLA